MKDRIVRAKNFVRAHNHGFATIGGLVVGAAVSYRYLNTNQGALQHLRLTVEQAKDMLDDPELCIEFDTPRQLIHVFVDSNHQ